MTIYLKIAVFIFLLFILIKATVNIVQYALYVRANRRQQNLIYKEVKGSSVLKFIALIFGYLFFVHRRRETQKNKSFSRQKEREARQEAMREVRNQRRNK